MSVSIAATPLLPAFVPALSSACSMLSVVSNPKLTGKPYFSVVLAMPLVASALT